MKTFARLSLLAAAALICASTMRADRTFACGSCCAPPPQAYRMMYQTFYDEKQVTAFRLETETQYVENKITVNRPVYETEMRERRYSVLKPVMETQRTRRTLHGDAAGVRNINCRQ